MSDNEPSLEDLVALSTQAPKGLPPARIQRALTAGDLEVARATSPARLPPSGEPVNALARVKSQHHHLARVLAEGHSNIEASARTGYSPARIALLQRDPAFCELIAHYSTTVIQPAYEAVHERLASLGLAAVEELAQRLEENPDDFKIREILEVMNAALDRSVAPSKSAGGKSFGGPSGTAPVAINVSFVSPDASTGAPTITITPEAQDEGV